ncbi:MAG: site-specific DNA-methyltransferase [Candidatus Azotimanducaceae bacterium WSBS_2022_MAG_OTU7]
MDKLKMHSPNITDENIAKLAELFPSCITESKDADGHLTRAIDFDQLKQELSNNIVEGPQERYQLNWPGKREALLTANAPIAKTLRPCREESVDFDTTENLFIEGDNLDVLKLLQETYLGKVKMIYIDPPYNTGNDFIYADNFSDSVDDHLLASGQKDEEGNRLVANTDSNGRFHSDWLSMIYPRLKLARVLLSDAGAIFISIDDNEASNLKKVCDEVFGESSFVADICITNNLKGRNDKKYIATANERLMMYVKTEQFNEYGMDISEELSKDYKEVDDVGKYRLLELRKRGGADTRSDRPNLFYSFFVNEINGNVSLEQDRIHTKEVIPLKSNGVEGNWRWGKAKAREGTQLLVARKVRGTEKYNIYQKDYLESDGEIKRIKPKSIWTGADYSTDSATKEYRKLMGELDFNNPKPLQFMIDLVTYCTDPKSNSIILDMFSGSGTTPHAVMARNSADGGNRKFIAMQFPERVPEDAKAFKAGIKHISDITKERIRRAGTKIKEDSDLLASDLDMGFRVLKLDDSNMSDVYYSPDALNQTDLSLFSDNIKDDRSSEDLLFQVLLDWGIDLTLPIKKKKQSLVEVFLLMAIYAPPVLIRRAKSMKFCKELAARSYCGWYFVMLALKMIALR